MTEQIGTSEPDQDSDNIRTHIPVSNFDGDGNYQGPQLWDKGRLPDTEATAQEALDEDELRESLRVAAESFAKLAESDLSTVPQEMLRILEQFNQHKERFEVMNAARAKIDRMARRFLERRLNSEGDSTDDYVGRFMPATATATVAVAMRELVKYPAFFTEDLEGRIYGDDEVQLNMVGGYIEAIPEVLRVADAIMAKGIDYGSDSTLAQLVDRLVAVDSSFTSIDNRTISEAVRYINHLRSRESQ